LSNPVGFCQERYYFRDLAWDRESFLRIFPPSDTEGAERQIILEKEHKTSLHDIISLGQAPSVPLMPSFEQQLGA